VKRGQQRRHATLAATAFALDISRRCDDEGESISGKGEDEGRC